MILLDTDHFSVSTTGRDPRHKALRARMLTANDEIACTIVSVEEASPGWSAAIHRRADVHQQLIGYENLAQLIELLTDWQVVRFDKAAADEFVRLRREKLRICTMDLKIASIALVNDALLVIAHVRDFSQVPRLRYETWLP